MLEQTPRELLELIPWWGWLISSYAINFPIALIRSKRTYKFFRKDGCDEVGSCCATFATILLAPIFIPILAFCLSIKPLINWWQEDEEPPKPKPTSESAEIEQDVLGRSSREMNFSGIHVRGYFCLTDANALVATGKWEHFFNSYSGYVVKKK